MKQGSFIIKNLSNDLSSGGRDKVGGQFSESSASKVSSGKHLKTGNRVKSTVIVRRKKDKTTGHKKKFAYEAIPRGNDINTAAIPTFSEYGVNKSDKASKKKSITNKTKHATIVSKKKKKFDKSAQWMDLKNSKDDSSERLKKQKESDRNVGFLPKVKEERKSDRKDASVSTLSSIGVIREDSTFTGKYNNCDSSKPTFSDKNGELCSSDSAVSKESDEIKKEVRLIDVESNQMIDKRKMKGIVGMESKSSRPPIFPRINKFTVDIKTPLTSLNEKEDSTEIVHNVRTEEERSRKFAVTTSQFTDDLNSTAMIEKSKVTEDQSDRFEQASESRNGSIKSTNIKKPQPITMKKQPSLKTFPTGKISSENKDISASAIKSKVDLTETVAATCATSAVSKAQSMNDVPDTSSITSTSTSDLKSKPDRRPSTAIGKSRTADKQGYFIDTNDRLREDLLIPDTWRSRKCGRDSDSYWRSTSATNYMVLSELDGNRHLLSKEAWNTGIYDRTGDAAFLWKQKQNSVPQFKMNIDASNQLTSRFELPLDMRVLEGMTPRTYLEKYCIISSRRQSLYLKLFMKYKDIKTQAVSRINLEKAFNEILIGTLTPDQLDTVLEIAKVSDETEFSQKFFYGLCCLTERLFFVKNMSGESMLNELQRETIEVADFFALDYKFKGVNVNPPMMRLLKSL